MASAVVNEVGILPDAFLECAMVASRSSVCGSVSPRVSVGSRDETASESPPKAANATEKADLDVSDEEDAAGFEFLLENPAMMLPADELFSDGKLVPLQMSAIRATAEPVAAAEIRSPEREKPRREVEAAGSLFHPQPLSPKAPRCSNRWKELLGLKKAAQAAKLEQIQKAAASPVPSRGGSHARIMWNFLHRNPKSTSIDASLSTPLLHADGNDPDGSITISARLSLSSSSSSSSSSAAADHEDLLPRLSLDSNRPSSTRIPPCKRRLSTLADAAPSPARIGRSPMRQEPTAPPPRCASVDSPRMNSSGKVVFQNLGRSSSSPSSFHGSGGQRPRPVNIRITPVLNVPVCSLRGSSKAGSVFGLFSPQKKEAPARTGRNGAGKGERGANA